MASFWTPVNQTRLKNLAAKKLLASEIAVELGVTRNSVIGRARRTGVKLLSPSHAKVKASLGNRTLRVHVLVDGRSA